MFNDSKIFELNEQQEKTLISELESILKITIPDDQKKYFILITNASRNFYYRLYKPQKPDYSEERLKLNSIENTTLKLKKLLTETDRFILNNIEFDDQCKYGLERDSTLIHDTVEYLDKISDGVKEARVQFDQYSYTRPLKYERLNTARDIAKVFRDIEIKASKTRGGKFDKVVRLVMSYSNFTINGEKSICPIPEDTFPILKNALDNIDKEYSSAYTLSFELEEIKNLFKEHTYSQN